jgi:hypothetical protein
MLTKNMHRIINRIKILFTIYHLLFFLKDIQPG